MYIAQVYNTLHDWWRYLIGTLIIIVGVIIGQIPFTIAVMYEVFEAGGNMLSIDEKTMMSALEPNLNLFLMLLSFAAGLFVLIFVGKVLHKQSLRILTTARDNIDWSRFWFAFIFWGIISTGLIFLDYYMEPESYTWNFKLVPFLILCVIAIALVPLQTSFEEYLFRGYLMQGIGTSTSHKKFPFVLLYSLIVIFAYVFINVYVYEFSMLSTLAYLIGFSVLLLVLTNLDSLDNVINVDNDKALYKVINRNSTPLILTSVMFGLLHIANPEIEQLGYILLVYYIGTGFFLGIMTLMDDGLELALGFHAANNLFTALLVTADWTAFQTHSIFKDMSQPEAAGFIDVFLPVFVLFPLVLFVFAKKYKWTNWKERLFGSINEPLKEDYKVIGEIEE